MLALVEAEKKAVYADCDVTDLGPQLSSGGDAELDHLQKLDHLQTP